MMPSNRFIAREDDVLDLETGIRYSTADDAEAVADLLNSTPPQPVSGDVVREAWDRVDELQTYLSALDSLEGADHQNASCAGDVAVEIRELVKLRNAATEARGRAAASASPEPEGVVIDGDFETRTTINDDKPDESVTCLYVGDVEVGEAIADVAGTGEFYDNDGSPERTFGQKYGPVRLTITQGEAKA